MGPWEEERALIVGMGDSLVEASSQQKIKNYSTINIGSEGCPYRHNISFSI